MTNENKGVETKEVDTTTNQTAPTDEPKTESQKVDTPEGSEENVSVSRKELEDLKKRALDFDRSVELKRLAKLEAKKPEASGVERDEILNEIRSLKEEINSFKITQKNSVVKDAYKEFISEHKWADNDDIFSKISEDFDGANLNSKEDVANKLKSIAMSKFPTEYEKHLLHRAQAKALAEKANVNSGEGSGGSAKNSFADTPKTEEDEMKERMEKALNRFRPNKK